MLGNGGSVYNIGRRWQEDRVSHDGRHEWVQEFIGGLVGKVVDVLVAGSSQLGIRQQRGQSLKLLMDA
jgi:hypothetical protein